MKNIKRHKNDTKTFNELTFEEQAKSINAQISILKKAISAHSRNTQDGNRVHSQILQLNIKQLLRLTLQLMNTL
jgi:hypothetical protein